MTTPRTSWWRTFPPRRFSRGGSRRCGQTGLPGIHYNILGEGRALRGGRGRPGLRHDPLRATSPAADRPGPDRGIAADLCHGVRAARAIRYARWPATARSARRYRRRSAPTSNLDDPFSSSTASTSGAFCTGLRQRLSGRPVLETIGQRLPVTVRLTVVAVVFETLFGVTAGILASLRRNSFFDNLVLVSTTMLVSIPVFVLGFLAQYLFGVQAGLVPRSPGSPTAG